jgi:hypothetical protein
MRPMRRLWPTLIALLGVTLLAAAPASAAVAASIENRISGSPSGSNNLVGIEPRLSEEAVGKKGALAYELASDDAVAARATKHMHHLLPQAKRFQQYFKRAGLDIEDFKIPLDKARHTLKPDGIHTNSGGNWNKVWDGFFQANPNATRQEILDQMAAMRQNFGI